MSRAWGVKMLFWENVVYFRLGEEFTPWCTQGSVQRAGPWRGRCTGPGRYILTPESGPGSCSLVQQMHPTAWMRQQQQQHIKYQVCICTHIHIMYICGRLCNLYCKLTLWVYIDNMLFWKLLAWKVTVCSSVFFLSFFSMKWSTM